MGLVETTAAALGRLALAAAFDGPQTAQEGANQSSPESAAPQVKHNAGQLANAALYTLVAATWLSERHTLQRKRLDKDAKAAVNFKDLLVAGTVVTGVADLVGFAARGNGSRKTLRLLNRVFVAGAVAITPFINFALFNDYRLHPVRSFFSF